MEPVEVDVVLESLSLDEDDPPEDDALELAVTVTETGMRTGATTLTRTSPGAC